MSKSFNVLFMGASYGSPLAPKLVLAGHNATLVYLPDLVEAVNRDGIMLRIPVRARNDLVEIDSRKAPGFTLSTSALIGLVGQGPTNQSGPVLRRKNREIAPECSPSTCSIGAFDAH